MKKTWKPTVAGILMIVAGCYMILLLAPGLFIGGGMYSDNWKTAVFWVLSFVMVAVGILGLVSGIFTLGRKKWWLALADSLVAILAGLIVTALDVLVLETKNYSVFSLIASLIPACLTIPILILIILSKKEFIHPVKTTLPTPN